MSSQLWADCRIAGPLAMLPVGKLVALAKSFRSYFEVFPCFREIISHQNTSIEFFDDFQQTWDECIDFIHQNPSWHRGNASPQLTLLHQTAYYVYNNKDLAILERRLELQLHIMNAKIDDILLTLFLTVLSQSFGQQNPDLAITGSLPQYGRNLPQSDIPVDQNAWPLFSYLVELQEALKRLRAPALGPDQRDRVWRLIITRFRAHELLSQNFRSIFSTDFTPQDTNRLVEYSRQSLRMWQSAYRSELLTPTLRRRVYSYSANSDSATFRLVPDYEEEPLHTIDVVTCKGSRWIVSTKRRSQLGIIQHLPSINNIHPYTKHEKFNAPQIRLFEPCNVDETNGTQTEHYQGMKPSYLFYSPSNADAFQCALRGKILQYTFQVKQIKSAHGFLGSAQPLKLWSDFDGKHQSVSFLQQYARPYCHVDIPLSILATTIYTDNSRNRVTVEIPAPRSGRVRRALDRAIRWMQRMGYFPNRSSRAPSDTSSVTGEQSTVFEDELTLDDVRFLTYLATLKIEFSSLHDAKCFETKLSEFFASRTRIIPESPSPEIPESIPSSGQSIHELATSVSGHYLEHDPESPLGESLDVTYSSPENRSMVVIPHQGESTGEDKDLDYRIRGIGLEQSSENLMSFLRQKLNLEANVVGRVKSFAVSHKGESKVAVISLKPRPMCLSTPGREEWIFGPESEDDDTLITVDTHFRGVTVLYAPSQASPHTIDICAVAGLGGHAWGSFKHKGGSQSSYMWILDALSKDFPTARIMVYGSKTRLERDESTQQSLDELGHLLRSEMLTVRNRRTLSNMSVVEPSLAVPSIFIAHSLGGLTVKEALLQEKEHPVRGSFIDTLHGALFFGVPSHGMQINGLRAIIRGRPNRTLIESLSYQSDTLLRLSQRFNAQFGDSRPRIIYFYETERSFTPKFSNGRWRMEGTPKDFLVNKDSATDGKCWTPDPVDIHPLNRDHSGLVKFSSPDDGDLERVRIELTNLLEYPSSRRL
ncbi:hypothetical protein DTO166G4_9085 [Paecilomyces variotii]|nr:hypothetical protein DTO166G4_9085 [Paecilomyces variotii]KAJ9229312.1 hypothetical protein DTO166G5_7987 [Paecilomyces variotii]KAJ9249109.1 hypothetical protein DTO207G8_6896 [Paecilomyces variotii]KAJ9372871.1 hypothetical protein DTO282E5_2281 [Paecilomyces variotii]KAJ9385890.1 hypothetical protein DTO063F5_4097 [Paecilomyces variotii]